MSVLAERQSVTNTFLSPAVCSAATRLWPGAKSVTVASCSASGAQTTVAMPPPSTSNARSRIEGNSSATRFSVAHRGSLYKEWEGCPAARRASSVASAAAIPLAVAAASAGHRKGVTGTTAHRRCNRQTLATRPGTRGASVRRHEVHVLRWLTLRAALPISAGRPPHGSMMLPMGARKQRPARALRSRVAGGPTSHSRRWFRAHQAGRNPGCEGGKSRHDANRHPRRRRAARSRVIDLLACASCPLGLEGSVNAASFALGLKNGAMMWTISRSSSIIRWQGYRVSASRLAESNFRYTQLLLDGEPATSPELMLS